MSGACSKCGKVGHFMRDCRSNGNENEWSLDQSNVAFNVMEGVTKESWIMDSGESTHMSNERGMFIEYTEEKNMRNVSSSKSGAKLKVLGYGTVHYAFGTDTNALMQI